MMAVEKKFPTILIIIGATGNLTRRKLIPALASLEKKGLLGSHFQIIGLSRRRFTAETYRQFLRKNVAGLSQNFLNRFEYVQADFENIGDYFKLAGRIKITDKNWALCANKIFYLAVSPTYTETILRKLHQSESIYPCSPQTGFARVAIEKPFGSDLKTATRLDQLLAKLFREEEIYRVDHYLAKGTVQNIINFRFDNAFFEKIWNRDFINMIRIKLFEREGLVGRGQSYDQLGALIDVGQNHLLQLLALITMANPISTQADFLREKKAEILESLPIYNLDQAKALTVRGQYRGYRREKGVAEKSETETYFKIETNLNYHNLRGVPIILEAGKKMVDDYVGIEIDFKKNLNCLCSTSSRFNQIIYRIQPNQGIEIKFLVKTPNEKNILSQEKFEFHYKNNLAEAYEKVLFDIIGGDRTVFVSTKEIMSSWRFISPIAAAWRKNAVPLKIYGGGFNGFELGPSNKNTPNQFSPKSDHRQIGIIGLGKMGGNLALRLKQKGWQVFGLDRSIQPESLVTKNIPVFDNLDKLIEKLTKPRLILLMLPADVVAGVIADLTTKFERGDVVIDAGNSFYENSIRHFKNLRKKGINFIDLGVSGGPAGALTGAVVLVGGEKKIALKFENLYRDLAQLNGYVVIGQPGAGHFVKMVHNGIEYGMMESIAEGFNLFRRSRYKLDLKKIASVFNHGSVIESKLIGWLEEGLADFGQELKKVSGRVDQTGEGKWTIETAKKMKEPVEAIAAAFKFRLKSAKKPSYAGKILTILRAKFGGHKLN
ncbi:MAG: glucose-6-phosphate dehydrogenase [Patescibacteria group bacterium]|nr:glucose-6-phosphate dehydrogenase [Patescibacteria group bacterium]MCL5257982.1 glucose-6-phosphate dehydrogenase [Patescibacteria group bacterium]